MGSSLIPAVGLTLLLGAAGLALLLLAAAVTVGVVLWATRRKGPPDEE
jgi:hypothetical protein